MLMYKMAESFFSNYARLAPSANELTGRSSKYAQVTGLQKSNKSYVTSASAPSANAPASRPEPMMEGMIQQQEPTTTANNTEAPTQKGGRSVRYLRKAIDNSPTFKAAVMPRNYM